MASPLRLNAALIEAAGREGAVQKRSVPRQIEFWAELGKAVESVVGPADVVAVIQGIKKIKVKPVASQEAIIPVKSDQLTSVAAHPFFNMAGEEPRTVQDQMNTLRKSRFNDV
jgi:hypothetical protein